MEYVFLFFFGWMVVCAPAIIFTGIANSRRRREVAELNDRLTSLTKQLENLEHRSRAESVRAAQPVTAPASSAPAMTAPAMKVSAEETRPTMPSHGVSVPPREPVVFEKPDKTAVPPPPPASAP